MLERIDFMPTQYLKKSPYTGNRSGMRYRLEKSEDQIKTTIWPGPFSFEKTAPEKKQSYLSSFDDDGLAAAISWLNEKYLEDKPMWDAIPIMGRDL